jgi:hypothetical protein
MKKHPVFTLNFEYLREIRNGPNGILMVPEKMIHEKSLKTKKSRVRLLLRKGHVEVAS